MNKGSNQSRFKTITFSVRELADLLDVSESTVRNWIRVGRLLGDRIGKCYRVFKTDFARAFGLVPEELDLLTSRNEVKPHDR